MRGKRVAVEYDPKQEHLFDKPRPTVVPLRGDNPQEGGAKE
jgi:hypothetical protein